MLKTLTVENFALIENVAVEFGEGLNILTGETGAGKSILIDALGAATGNRVGVNRIRKGADNLRIAATFDDGLTIERKVSRSSKSSVTVDGKSTTPAQLKKICAALVDVHGQNKSLELLREEKIYALIDDEKISDELTNFRRLYKSLTTQSRALAEKISARADNLQRLEFLRWQEQEISSAHLKPDEDSELDAEIRKLSHAEKIVEHVQQSAQILNDGDDDILTALARVSETFGGRGNFLARGLRRDSRLRRRLGLFARTSRRTSCAVGRDFQAQAKVRRVGQRDSSTVGKDSRGNFGGRKFRFGHGSTSTVGRQIGTSNKILRGRAVENASRVGKVIERGD